jgi:hypothetical protein
MKWSEHNPRMAAKDQFYRWQSKIVTPSSFLERSSLIQLNVFLFYLDFGEIGSKFDFEI